MFHSLREQLLFEIDDANLPIRSEQIRARLRSYPRMVAARGAVTLMVLGLMWGKVAAPVLLGWAGMLFLMYAIESLLCLALLGCHAHSGRMRDMA